MFCSDEQDFCVKALPLRVSGPCIQSRLVVIGDAAKFPAHKLPEQIIHTVQHLAAAAEILVKIDPLPGPVLQIVRVEFLHEKLRPGETEPIDALLYVPHHENIVPALGNPGNAGQDRFLDQIAVLIFIDHDLIELPLILPGRVRRDPFPFFHAREDAQGILLHI